MEAVGTLAGGVAHDFNNILTVIMGLSNLIQMSIDKDDILRPYVDQIVASSERAAELTQSLLAFGRKQRIALEPHKVNGVVRARQSSSKDSFPRTSHLTMSLADEDAASLLDITQIGQVLMNLATNARDAMPHGGSLTIATDKVTLDESFRKIHGFGLPGDYVKLSVSDTGTGMDERTMEHIFEPFFTTKEVGKGTGLGLASAYGIMKQHNGYINVSSRPGEGSTFLLYLPEVKEKPRETRSAVHEAKGGSETLLLAEDNADIRSVMSGILKMSGYTVIDAVNGRNAVEKFREHQDEIKLVILDVVMPEENGRKPTRK